MRSARGQDPLPIQPVENPVICKPYEEPLRYWEYQRETGEARLQEGERRPAAYWYRTEQDTRRGQLRLELQEERRELRTVNALRRDVRRWRESGWEGATNVTKDLLRHWWNPDRPRRFFFCQLEAAETAIYLTEIRGLLPDGRRRRPRFNPDFSDEDFAGLLDRPVDGNGYSPLTRYGCKMATGSGKTVVMAMLISWAFCNRGRQPSDARFPRGVLVVCPNLTVKERLQVLRPGNLDGDYFSAFDVVPAAYRELLDAGKVLVTNWHLFAPESAHVESGRSYAVVNKGAETDDAFARRVLGDLYGRAPLMVLNDEAHHAYRPAPIETKLTGAEAREAEEMNQEATVWVQGLDRINAAAGIRTCIDLSATPFYIQGSGYPEGEPFPWLVSDFGLVDAIESGITKIPRLPVSDTTGRPEPRYFRLWQHVTRDLAPAQRLSNGRPKPEVVWERAEDALQTLAGEYKKAFDSIDQANDLKAKAPPVMILVCDNTDIAEEFHRAISGEEEIEAIDASGTGDEEDSEDAAEGNGRGKKPKKTIRYNVGRVFPGILQNSPGRRRTLRIDSKLLAKAETEDPSATREKAAEELRRIVSTVGKLGQPGEQVRCVVSVAMLSEGWDANNVTHILGLRAFGSQLLCEQVVGRGLRRMNYTPDPDTGMLIPEYVDVYGIPFSVIPYKGQPKNPPPPPPPPNHVYAMRERAEMEMRFPNVEGYVHALKRNLIKADIAAMEPLVIEPDRRPTAVFLKAASGYGEGYVPAVGPGGFVEQNRKAFYAENHLQGIEFEMARRVVGLLVGEGANAPVGGSPRLRGMARHQLFPQVFRCVREYVDRKVDFRGQHRCELGLETYVSRIVERMLVAIEPNDAAGEPPLVPLLNRYKPTGTTADVNFMTTKSTHATERSHVNQIVLDSSWEQSAAFYLEQAAGDAASGKPVDCYVRNERPFMLIPYEYEGVPHTYAPDYLVRLRSGASLVLEVKGLELDQTRAKHQAARRWISAVNHWGKLGCWRFHVCRDPQLLGRELAYLARET